MAIEGRRKRLEQMERDRDTVMEHYAGTIPGSLDDLGPEERHKIYKMLRLEVLAYPDKSLQVSDAILAGEAENEGGRAGCIRTNTENSAPPQSLKDG